MLTNTENSFGSIFKFFHWILFILVSFMITLGLYMASLPDKDPLVPPLFSLHEATGVLVLGLSVLWILWGWGNVSPKLPKDMMVAQKILARFVQYCLYTLLILTPVTGIIMTIYSGHSISFYGLFTIPSVTSGPTELSKWVHFIHVNLVFFWFGFVGLHVIGAFYHYFIRKDQILQRMLPWKS